MPGRIPGNRGPDSMIVVAKTARRYHIKPGSDYGFLRTDYDNSAAALLTAEQSSSVSALSVREKLPFEANIRRFVHALRGDGNVKDQGFAIGDRRFPDVVD